MNTAFNIDCMEYMKSLPDNTYDLAVVDPPYGLPKDSTNGRGKLRDCTFNRGNITKWDIPPEAAYFEELFRVSKNQVIWGELLPPSAVQVLPRMGQNAAVPEFQPL